MYPRGVIAAIAIALSGTAAMAFAVTISGNVVDETGLPVAGARVIAEAPGVSAAGTSNASGAYRVEVPAAGEYELRVEREGFFLLTNRQTLLEPGTPLDIRLIHVKELAESIDVPYSPPVVDPDRTSEVKRLDGQTILNLPYVASQDYRRTLRLLPGAVQDSGGIVHFNGGAPNETSYRLDGFDISNTATGGLTARLSVDTIQAVEWNSDRMPVENKGSAGTVEVKTEMGDDRWRFGTTNPIPGFSTAGGFHINHWSPRLMASGPIKKGKAWFHTALDPLYTSDTITALPNGKNRTSSFSGSNLTRLQWKVSDWQTLTGSFLYNRGDIRHNGLSILNPAETTTNGRTSLSSVMVKDQFILNGNLIEAGFASNREFLRMSPLGTASYLITPAGAAGNYFRDQTSHATRQEGIFNVAFKQVHGVTGTHQIRAGTDIENSHLEQRIVRSAVSVVRGDSSLVRSVAFAGPTDRSPDNLEVYTYAADHWSPIRSLTFDIGIRTQWNRITGSTPPAPRLGMAWAPGKSARTKLSAGWGVYYDPIPLAFIALGAEQSSFTSFYAPGNLLLGAPLESVYRVDNAQLRAPRFTVKSVSVESLLPGNFLARVDLMSRQGNRGIVLDQYWPLLPISQQTANTYTANNSQHASYRAAEVTVRRTFLSKYQWSASYTRSEAKSNAAIAYTIENPLLTPQAGGPQPWDAPNRFVMWGWAPLEKKWLPRRVQAIAGDTDVQLLTEYHTGFAFSSTTQNGYLYGAPGSKHFPDYFTVNVALERRFHFRGHLWAWRVGLVNALGRSNPNVVNSDANSPLYLRFQPGQARAINVRVRFLGKK